MPPFYAAHLLLFLLHSFTDLSSSSALPPLTPPSPPPEGSAILSTGIIIGSVATTATSTFVVATAFFFCLTCFRPQRRERALTPAKVQAASRSEHMQYEEIRDLIVDEDGLDVLYWKKLKNFNGSIHKDPAARVNYGSGDWRTSTAPSGRSSSSYPQMLPGQRSNGRISGVALQAPVNYGGGGRPLPFYPSSSSAAVSTAPFSYDGGVGSGGQPLPLYSAPSSAVSTAPANYGVGVGSGGQPLPLYPAPSSAVSTAPANYGVGVGSGGQPLPLYASSISSANLTAPGYSSTAVLTASTLAPPIFTPPTPPPASKVPPTAPPQPPAPAKKAPPPPPPPAPGKKAPPPPPPPKAGKKAPPPPGPPKPPSAGSKRSKEDGSGSGKDQVMLKPLHWEKLNVNPEHSMVWDKIERGSFQYNDDKMEALFGVVPGNRKSAMEDNANSKPADPNAKIFILDPKKSRNTSIVLKSLGIPRSELIDCLLEGKGLRIEILEKLGRTVPTREEESEILAFDGDPTKLADAESFLYNLLKAVPLAFTRANAMLFRLNYKSEILNVKEPLQVMEPACNELRSHGMFLRLLEAILKAGNRLNAGTARGDAKAFNLTTLLKLSDFKSSDGKTTLLSFVVHEVVRNEGRKTLLAQKKDANDLADKEEKEKELLRLGLPAVSGLSSEFSNVKKAASIDYDAVKSTLSSLRNRLEEIKQMMAKCKSSGGGGGFLKEMDKFLESAEGEMKEIEEENKRVMELVKKTTQYYQAGASNDKNPLQLFTIVKDFLGMVDQTCAVIGRGLQTRKASSVAAGAAAGSSSTQQDPIKTRVIFPGLKEHLLLANKSNINSSDSDDDF